MSPLVLAHGVADATDIGIAAAPVVAVAAAVVVGAGGLATRLNRTGVEAPPPALAESLGPVGRTITSLVGVLLVTSVIAIATLGVQDEAANPAGRLIFIIGWGLVVVISALIGPFWTKGNLWRLLATDTEVATIDDIRPAAVLMLLFVIAAQVLEPAPSSALVFVALYAAAVASAALVGRGWLQRVDPFIATSTTFGWLAPVGRADGRLTLRSPRLALASATTPSGFDEFVSVVLAGALLDALGLPATVLARLGAVGGFFVAARLAMAALNATPQLKPAFMGAVAGHVAAQLFGHAIVDGQVAVIQLSDPLGSGWNLLGLTGSDIAPTLMPLPVAATILLALLIGGHVLAILAGDVVARRTFGQERAASAQLAFRAAVVLSAVAGVWLRLA